MIFNENHRIHETYIHKDPSITVEIVLLQSEIPIISFTACSDKAKRHAY